ncbi:hypothetical protein Bca4012_004448 [Brassica carinata]|uniref:Uncharacterized protein n=1 Tax=Brassica carinata TaxID=52824 RepID=A0A8X7UW54_BRACI|nr:hypothetical protein Bca52824_041134 [Brassica carinata]
MEICKISVTGESHHKKINGSSGQSRDWLNSDTSEVCAALVTRSSPDLRVFSPLDSTRQVGVEGSSYSAFSEAKRLISESELLREETTSTTVEFDSATPVRKSSGLEPKMR